MELKVVYFTRPQNDSNYTLSHVISGHMHCQTTIVVLLVFSFSSVAVLCCIISRSKLVRFIRKKTAYFKFKTRDYRITEVQ